MLLEDERHVVKWLSQYGALPKAQVVRLLRDKSPQTARENHPQSETGDADIGCGRRVLSGA